MNFSILIKLLLLPLMAALAQESSDQDKELYMEVFPEGYDFLNVTGKDTNRCRKRDCVFNWVQDIDENSDLAIMYTIREGWETIDQDPNIGEMQICDAAADTTPGSKYHDAWRLVSLVTAGGIENCPIKAGAYPIAEKVNFKASYSDTEMCGENWSFEAGLVRKSDPSGYLAFFEVRNPCA